MTIASEVKNTIKYWWIYFLIGVLFILGAFYIFSVPDASYLSLSILFSVLILFDGIGSILLALSNRNMEGWGWQLAGGIISTLIGFSLVLHPALSLAMLPLFVGFWILLRGSFITGISFDLKKQGSDGWGWILLLGVLTILFGIAMILNPLFGATMILSFTAVSFIFFGIAVIFISLKLRKVKVGIEHVKKAGSEKLEALKKSVDAYLQDEGADLKAALKSVKKGIDDAMKE